MSHDAHPSANAQVAGANSVETQVRKAAELAERRTRRPTWLRYGLPMLVLAAVVALKLLLAPFLGNETPFILIFSTVAFAAWFGGTGPALWAVLCGAVASAYFFLPPHHTLLITTRGVRQLSLFLLECSAIVFLSYTLQRARRRAERSEQTFATTLRSIGDAVIATDADGIVVFMNGVAEQLTGWSLGDAAGKPLERIFHILNEETRAVVESPVDKVIREGVIVGMANHTALIARGGREHSIEDSAAPIRDDGGGLQGIVMVFRDVSDERREQARRRLLAEASAALVESLDVSVTLGKVAHLAVPALGEVCALHLVDHEGGIEPVATATTMKAPGAADGAAPSLDGAAGDLAAAAIRTGTTQQAGAASGPAGAPPLRGWLSVPFAAHGKVLGALTVGSTREGRYDAVTVELAEDLARRCGLAVENARLFQEARQAVAVRDEFLSIASHELRTPLTPLSLHLESLARQLDGSAPPRTTARLESAIRQTERISRLVESLLDASRLSAGRLVLNSAAFDLTEMARQVIEQFRPEAARAESTVSLRADGPVVGSWDRLRLEQALMNLLSNAAKYAPRSEIEVAVVATADHASLIVTDRGIGIAADDLRRIFERFERAVPSRNYGGLGLGLYVTRQIAEAHGGSVRVESTPGEGARFTIELPRQPVAGGVTDSASAAAPPPDARAILLADDDPDIRESVAELLREEGYHVTTAADGQEALQRLRGLTRPPRLILLDLRMPVMDGWAFLEARREWPDLARIPVLMFSADRGAAQDARAQQAAGFLQKPLRIDDLLRAVTSTIS